jgi:hypothetical protein
VLTTGSALVSDLGDAFARDPEVRQARMIAHAARTRLLTCVTGSEDEIDLAEARGMLDALGNAQTLAEDAEDRVLVHRGLLTSREAELRAAQRRPVVARADRADRAVRGDRAVARADRAVLGDRAVVRGDRAVLGDRATLGDRALRGVRAVGLARRLRIPVAAPRPGGRLGNLPVIACVLALGAVGVALAHWTGVRLPLARR